MTTYDPDEQEQIEALKAWWAKYGNLVMGVLTVVLLAVASWQAWNWYQRSQGMQAAGYFEALQGAARQGNAPQAGNASETLRSKFASTAYAPRGALVAAKAFVDAGEVERARVELQWVVDERKSDPLAAVARIRLAGILLDEKQFDAALALVNEPAPSGYEALYADRRGDVLYAQGNIEAARAAWQNALEFLGPQNAAMQPVIQLKIDALGGAAT